MSKRLKPSLWMQRGLARGLALFGLSIALGCVSQPSPDAERALSRLETLETATVSNADSVFPPQELATMSAPAPATAEYLLGPGDRIRLNVAGQADLGAEHPPFKFLQVDDATQVAVNLAFMHGRAYAAIKELDDVDADGDGASSIVGITWCTQLQ